MKRLSWETKLGIFLIISSIVIYSVKELIVHDPKNTISYLFNAIGFLPINVLLVTLVLNKLLTVRSKRERLEKMNMVIGTFFSDTGTRLLTTLSDYDPRRGKLCSELIVTDEWDENEFARVDEKLKSYDYSVDISMINLESLSDFLSEKRSFLLRLLENPNLLEHESFTELLQAVFHLTEELERRENLSALPETDYAHLSGDIKRVYGLLAHQWLDYMKYLKKNYPYMFSLAMRTNPFDETASPVVKG